jgi:two-component system NtrC family sensor kinase
VIQGNLDLLRETLGNEAEPRDGRNALIEEQVERMRLIVTQLLQFARPTEYAGYVEPVDLDQVLQDSLVLVAHLLKKTRITVVQDLRATPPVSSTATSCSRC